jgi:nucleoside-diphosphate-sugar epimerase
VRLASLAKFAEVPRFLFSSSCAVYGSASSRYVDENAPLHPLTTFAQAKMRAEHDISRLADADFAPIFLRKPTMYGLSPYHRTDTALNNLVAWGATTGRIVVKSEGSAWRPYLHVEDVARAFLLALNAPTHDIHNQVFNVVKTEDNYQVRTLAALVADVVPRARVEVVTDALQDVRSYRVDGSKIMRHLPMFEPRWTPEQGIAQLFEAYHDRLLKLDDFEGPRYKRVAYLKSLLASGRVDEGLRWASQNARSGG